MSGFFIAVREEPVVSPLRLLRETADPIFYSRYRSPHINDGDDSGLQPYVTSLPVECLRLVISPGLPYPVTPADP